MAHVPGVGLSVGATRLAAVTADRGITGDAVFRLPDGELLTGFVDRIGDPIAVIDAHGRPHRAEDLLAGALRELADAATGGRRPPGLAISLPGHWSPAAVGALRRTLPRFFDGATPMLLPDYAAAIAALIRRPGLPTHGIIALCDIGGSGTSLTLLDADNGYRRVGETRRSGEFGGDLVDRTVLTHVLDALPDRLDATATSAIGTLGELRRECRDAKHRLSAATVTAVTAHLPGGPAELRLTRAELDELTAPGLRRLLDEMESLLTDHGIGPSRLATIATVGGMAAMPAVTTALSQRLRVPVITAPAPALTAATGAALRAVRNPAAEAATALQSAAVAPAVAPVTELANAAPVLALAWSECDDAPEPVPFTGEIDPAALDVDIADADIDDAASYGADVDREPAEAGENRTTARPLIAFAPVPEPPAVPDTRRRHPVLTALVAAALIAGGISGVAVALTYTSSESSTATQAAPVTAAPSASPAPQADAPTVAPLAAPVVQTGTAPVAPTVAAPAAPVAEAPQVVQGPVVQVNNQRPIAAAPAPEPAAAPAEIPAPTVDPVAVPFPVPSLQIPDLTLGLPILGDGMPRGNQPSQPREAPASPTPSPTSPAPSPKPSPEPAGPKPSPTPAPSSPSPTPKSPEPSAPSSTATPPSPTHSAPAPSPEPSPSPAPKHQEPEPQEPAPSAGSPASTANPDARGHRGQ